MLKKSHAYGGTGNRLVELAGAPAEEAPSEWAGCLLQVRFRRHPASGPAASCR
jgi:hypothetical protein